MIGGIVARQDAGYYEFCEVQGKGERESKSKSKRGLGWTQATGLDADGRRIR
jgi:hypothetical protein